MVAGKTCFKCGETKPRSEFHAHKRMADGLLGKCKKCTCADIRAHRRNPKFREKVLAYDRARGSRESPEETRQRRLANPNKRASEQLNNAIRDGKVKKEHRCELCGAIGIRIEGHHFDYSKPLVVIWLCSACHKQAHVLDRLAQRALKRAS